MVVGTQKKSQEKERERDPRNERERMFNDLSLGFEGVNDQTRK